MHGSTKDYPFLDIPLATRSLRVTPGTAGDTIVQCETPLNPYPRQLGDLLRQQAAARGDQAFLVERDADDNWAPTSYAAVRQAADAVSGWLLANGHGPDRPVACLSDNSVHFAMLMLGAMQVGIPFLPVSPAYSLMSEDFEKINYVINKFDPSLIYVQALAPFARALQAIDRKGRHIVADADSGEIPDTIPFDDLLAAPAGEAVEAAFAAVDGDSTAKILLTSGSTGMPKGVINTQKMLCSNAVMMTQLWPFMDADPLVLCDWLPWNHTFGANFCFNQILLNGGTLYLDRGKPVPGRFETSIANLKSVKPTILVNVPRAYDMLIPVLEQDDAFAEHLFSDLSAIFFAGAALPQNLWDRLEALSIKVRGKRIPLLSSLGATETAPAAIVGYWGADVTGAVGLPGPGIEARLVAVDDKTEIRLKGPNITPGYYGDAEKTAAAFDEDGWYKIGDAVKWLNPDDPMQGLMFDGRVAENFKLMSGTWVAVGNLRVAALSATSPLTQDAVVTGDGREEVGLLIFPNLPACQALVEADGADLSADALVRHPAVLAAVQEKLAAYNQHHPGSSQRVTRALLMAEPANIDAGEITDKGYLNQRAILRRRADLVEQLYADTPRDHVILMAR